jgi:predicted HTH transcriptional regulator
MARFPRVEAAIGESSLESASEVSLRRLLNQVREDTEIEFKGELYGQSDTQKRDLAIDVTAMANALGGVIFLGVVAKNGMAIRLAPLTLNEGEEIRMRQVVCSL